MANRIGGFPFCHLKPDVANKLRRAKIKLISPVSYCGLAQQAGVAYLIVKYLIHAVCKMQGAVILQWDLFCKTILYAGLNEIVSYWVRSLSVYTKMLTSQIIWTERKFNLFCLF